MDPTTNPTPTPTPTPTPAPTPASPEPTAPAATPEPAAQPAPAPMPSTGAPMPNSSAPVNPTPAAPAVNPVINPAATSPFIQQNGVAATDPIMMPEPAKAPDPVEEELKAPMKAAAPAPGSIGSAVSGPSEAAPTDTNSPADNPFSSLESNQTPSVAFNDPANTPDAAAPAKKKTNKNTLIILIVVAVMIVIALAAVLIMQLMGNQPGSNSTPNNNNNSAIVQPEEQTDDTDDETTTSDLICTNSIVYAEGGTTYAAGVASAQTKYSYTFAGGDLTSVVTDETITHTDGTTDTSSETLTVDEYRAKAGFNATDVLTIASVTENFENNINNFVTDTNVNSSDVTSVTNSCTEQ